MNFMINFKYFNDSFTPIFDGLIDFHDDLFFFLLLISIFILYFMSKNNFFIFF